jgi:hypothetical protein
MKLSRIIKYGIAGIITGLIIENQFLVVRQRAIAKARKLQKKTQKLVQAN